MGQPLLGAKKDSGGDSSAVQDQLKDVQEIQATAFSPSLRFWQMDSSSPGVVHNGVVANSAVRDQLKGVKKIQTTSFWPLLPFVMMDVSLPGDINPMAATVQQFKIS